MYEVGDKVRLQQPINFDKPEWNHPDREQYFGKEATIVYRSIDEVYKVDIDDRLFWWPPFMLTRELPKPISALATFEYTLTNGLFYQRFPTGYLIKSGNQMIFISDNPTGTIS